MRLSAASLLIALAFGAASVAFAAVAPPDAQKIFAQADAAGESESQAAPDEGERVYGPYPIILRDESALPAPVRETRQKLIDVAKSGDIEQLRMLMQAQPKMPSVSYGDPGDPIEYLKALSADADGREILAILLEVLQSGFLHVDEGTDGDHFLWPYFADYPLNALTPEQLVELFTLVTAADYEDMKSYGAYTFFRVGIAPDGSWLFFVAGD